MPISETGERSKAMKTDTKEEYEAWVNTVPVADSDLQSNGGRIPDGTETYGTWLRQHDPVAFNIGYREWAAENEELHSRCCKRASEHPTLSSDISEEVYGEQTHSRELQAISDDLRGLASQGGIDRELVNSLVEHATALTRIAMLYDISLTAHEATDLNTKPTEQHEHKS